MKKIKGFTLVEVMIVVLIIGALLAIAVPGFAKSRKTTRHKTIVANLKAINDAKAQCALTEGLSSGDTGRCNKNNLINRGYLKTWPTGPISGTYGVKPIGESAVFRGKDDEWWVNNPNSNLLQPPPVISPGETTARRNRGRSRRHHRKLQSGLRWCQRFARRENRPHRHKNPHIWRR